MRPADFKLTDAPLLIAGTTMVARIPTTVMTIKSSTRVYARRDAIFFAAQVSVSAVRNRCAHERAVCGTP